MLSWTRRHSDHEEVQLQGLRLLRHLCLVSPLRQALSGVVVATVCRALSCNETRRTTQLEALATLCNACTANNDNRVAMVEAGCHKLVMSVASDRVKEFDFLLATCKAIQVGGGIASYMPQQRVFCFLLPCFAHHCSRAGECRHWLFPHATMPHWPPLRLYRILSTCSKHALIAPTLRQCFRRACCVSATSRRTAPWPAACPTCRLSGSATHSCRTNPQSLPSCATLWLCSPI